ncbi:ABC transporter permease [Intestinimonas sp.]|uniref:ABC transporter permease n=1 Tax=Intestinimonas sp. TaxID=1965293 RepID=UPI003AB08E72
MAKYLVKRVLMALLTVFLVATLTFFLMNAAPGNPWLAEKTPPQSVIDALNEKYGLDKPLPEQYIRYMSNLLQGDFGTSIKMSKNRPVLEMIMEKFPISAKLGIVAVAWATLVGVPLGCLAAYRRGKLTDSILRVVCTLGVSLPAFVVASTLMVVFCGGVEALHFFPNTFSEANGIRGYILPCLCLGLYPMCYIARLTRSSMLDAINQEYIKTARAKGLKTAPILFKHALRNALVPIVTVIGMQIPVLFGGAVIVEQLFSWPGLGLMTMSAILNRDYPVIMGVCLLSAVVVLLANLVTDIVYAVVNPAIQYD